jgi:hypothetical protein
LLAALEGTPATSSGNAALAGAIEDARIGDREGPEPGDAMLREARLFPPHPRAHDRRAGERFGRARG